MFETSSVTSTGRKFHPLTLAISALLHVVAISAIVFVTIWDVDIPDTKPKQVSTFQVSQAPPMPPPAEIRRGDPQAPREREAPREQADPLPVEQDTLPQVIPDSIPTEGDAGESSDAGDVFGHPDGDPLGEEDGALDGEAGGVGSGDGGGGVIDSTTYTPGNGVSSPVIIHRVEPDYPPMLQRIGMSGVARVECVISPSGQLTDVRVIHATHALFGEAAVKAVKQWRFLPGRLGDRPVSTRFDFTVNFTVRR